MAKSNKDNPTIYKSTFKDYTKLADEIKKEDTKFNNDGKIEDIIRDVNDWIDKTVDQRTELLNFLKKSGDNWRIRVNTLKHVLKHRHGSDSSSKILLGSLTDAVNKGEGSIERITDLIQSVLSAESNIQTIATKQFQAIREKIKFSKDTFDKLGSMFGDYSKWSYDLLYNVTKFTAGLAETFDPTNLKRQLAGEEFKNFRHLSTDKLISDIIPKFKGDSDAILKIVDLMQDRVLTDVQAFELYDNAVAYGIKSVSKQKKGSFNRLENIMINRLKENDTEGIFNNVLKNKNSGSTASEFLFHLEQRGKNSTNTSPAELQEMWSEFKSISGGDQEKKLINKIKNMKKTNVLRTNNRHISNADYDEVLGNIMTGKDDLMMLNKELWKGGDDNASAISSVTGKLSGKKLDNDYIQQNMRHVGLNDAINLSKKTKNISLDDFMDMTKTLLTKGLKGDTDEGKKIIEELYKKIDRGPLEEQFKKRLKEGGLDKVYEKLLSLFNKMMDKWKEIWNAQNQSRVTTGLIKSNTNEIYEGAINTAKNVAGWGVSMSDIANIQLAMIKNYGTTNSHLINEERLMTNISKFAKQMGMDTGQAAEMFSQIMLTTGKTQIQTENMLDHYTILGRTAKVDVAGAFKDISQNSEFVAMYTKNGMENIMDASIYAKSLGINLSTVAKMADHLLNFESSISSQVKASVMLGKQLDLDSARYHAFNGDFTSMVDSIRSQLGGMGKSWEDLNYIQRKSLAESIGMSVDEYSKFNTISKNAKMNHKEWVKSLENSKTPIKGFLDAMPTDQLQNWNAMMASFAGIVTKMAIVIKPVMDGMSHVFGFIADLLNTKLGSGVAVVLGWAASITFLVSSVLKLANSFKVLRRIQIGNIFGKLFGGGGGNGSGGGTGEGSGGGLFGGFNAKQSLAQAGIFAIYIGVLTGSLMLLMKASKELKPEQMATLSLVILSLGAVSTGLMFLSRSSKLMDWKGLGMLSLTLFGISSVLHSFNGINKNIGIVLTSASAGLAVLSGTIIGLSMLMGTLMGPQGLIVLGGFIALMTSIAAVAGIVRIIPSDVNSRLSGLSTGLVELASTANGTKFNSGNALQYLIDRADKINSLSDGLTSLNNSVSGFNGMNVDNVLNVNTNSGFDKISTKLDSLIEVTKNIINRDINLGGYKVNVAMNKVNANTIG